MGAIDYPGLDGFLGTRATFMLDVLVLAMAVVVVVLAWSIYQVKYRRRYQVHKWVQVSLGTVLLAAVLLFEIDVRLHGWEERAAGRLGGHAGATRLDRTGDPPCVRRVGNHPLARGDRASALAISRIRRSPGRTAGSTSAGPDWPRSS